MASDEGIRTELYLRADPPPAVEAQQRTLKSRLEAHLGSDGLTTRTHPPRVPYDDHDVVAGYEAAREWADAAGVSLSPFFDRREGYDPDAGRVRDHLVLPVLWLTVENGSGTRAVFPHVDDEVRTVSEAVSALEAGDPVFAPATGPTDAQTGSNR